MNNQKILKQFLCALSFAANRHKFDRTKSDEPFINHLIDVCSLLQNVANVNDPTTLVAATLHDILEKTTTKTDEINTQFGEEVCNIVIELTNDQRLNETEKWFLQLHTADNLSAKSKIIKLADKIANAKAVISNPPKGWDIKRRIVYLQWTEKVVGALRGTDENLENYFDQLMEEEKKLIKSPLWLEKREASLT